MKKKTTLELVEQSAKVSLYSISFEIDGKTEFEKFLEKFESVAKYNRDYQKILYALQIILYNGVLERYFRPEGKMSDSLNALPVDSCRLRLYCLRISDEILILGNGDVKATQKYESDSKLLGYTIDLQKFDALLKKDLEDGVVKIEEKTLNGIDGKIYEI